MATHIFISLDVLNTILKEEILEWTVTETASVQDKHFTYTLSDSEQKMICLISTAQGNGDGRFLQIAFLSSPTTISTYPVSYTHLDVYKRQAISPAPAFQPVPIMYSVRFSQLQSLSHPECRYM